MSIISKISAAAVVVAFALIPLSALSSTAAASPSPAGLVANDEPWGGQPAAMPNDEPWG